MEVLSKLSVGNDTFIGNPDSHLTMTIDVDSKDHENDYNRFWNYRSKVLSRLLFIPHKNQTKVNYEDTNIHMLKATEYNPTYFPKFDLKAELKETKLITERTILVTRKMEIQPRREAKWIDLIDIFRWAYNLHIGKLSEKDRVKEDKSLTVITREVKEHIGSIIDTKGLTNLIGQACMSADTSFRRLLKDSKRDGQRRRLGFKSKKHPKQTMYIPRVGLKGPLPTLLKETIGESFTFRERKEALRYYQSTFGRKPTNKEINEYYLKNNIKTTKSGNKDLRTATVTFENDRWFISVYKQRSVVVDNQDYRDNVVALDPGTNPFLTSYDGTRAIRIGVGLHKELLKLDMKIDNLISIKTLSLNNIRKKLPHKRINGRLVASQRHRDIERYFDKKIHKIRFRRHNVLNHFQWKCASYLTTEYKTILLPKLETQKITKKKKKVKQAKINKSTRLTRLLNVPSKCKQLTLPLKLNKKSIKTFNVKKLNRNILSMNHYQFILKMQYLARVNNCTLLHPSESHTSKTLCLNGYYNDKLGSSKTYKHKDITIDRDINGAINIMLKFMNHVDIVYSIKRSGKQHTGLLASSDLKNVKSQTILTKC